MRVTSGSRPYPGRTIFCGGAKAHTVESEGMRLQSVVRRLRTTHCKRTPSNSAMCAFAPPEKMARFNVLLVYLMKIDHKSCYNSCYSAKKACYNFLNRVTTRVTLRNERVTTFFNEKSSFFFFTLKKL